MFTPLVRIILTATCLMAAIHFYSKDDFVNMSMMLLASGLFIYGYFKYGTVYAAFQQMKKNDLKKAEALISKVKNPDRLSKENKGFYYFTKGIIYLDKQELDKSHHYLTQALENGLRTENNQSIVLLNLADIEFSNKNYTEAKEYINKVKSFDLKPLIQAETIRLEGEIDKVMHSKN